MPSPARHLRVIPGGRETARNAPQRPPVAGVAILLTLLMLAIYAGIAVIVLA